MSLLEQKFEELTPKKLFKWLAWILAGASAIAVGAFGWYFMNFNVEVSQKQEIWGMFGDYIGGILNPVFSFLALVALLLTIVLQSKELEETRKELERTADASSAQVVHFASQQKRDDIYKLIIKLSERINNNYNNNYLKDGHSIHRALRGPHNVNKNARLMKLYNEALDTNTVTYRIIKHVEGDLIRLQSLLEEYENISVSTPFPAFYRSEYCEMVKVFHELGLLKKDELYNYFCQKLTANA